MRPWSEDGRRRVAGSLFANVAYMYMVKGPDMDRINQKEFYQNAIQQLNTVCSLLGGFSFTAMTILVTVTSPSHPLLTSGLVVMATLVLVGASIIGCFFHAFHLAVGTPDRTPPVFLLWFLMVPLGILLFFASLVSLAFSVGTWIGVVSMAVVLGVVVLTGFGYNSVAMASGETTR
jgi:hypothetical protein